MLCILTSSILLAAEDYVDPNAARNGILMYFDYIFVAVFAVEMFVKMVAMGIILH
jgi:voltage-dependent calcium channel L type alpha-1D